MERTAASLLLFSRATRTPDLSPIHAPQTYVGYIPIQETWDPSPSFWKTVLRVLFAGFHSVRLEEREQFQKLRSPFPTHEFLEGKSEPWFFYI